MGTLRHTTGSSIFIE
uniref:Uncharacterized protein n=1 Tax=Anguilla anguilla TaxID=7936 RepID=A0A0E9PVJ1_ANGAN